MSTTLAIIASDTSEPNEKTKERRATFVLLFTVPMAVLALTGSFAGIFFDAPYSGETENWVAQAVAQDLVNLVAFLALAILAILAVRGSLRAYLAWLGVVAYSAYTYAIYAFALHFGPLFLVHVAVFGMSIYALIVGLVRIDYEHVRKLLPVVCRAALSLPCYLRSELSSTYCG